MAAPITPPPQPTSVRRVTLPLYQMSCAQASSFHFSVIAVPPSGCHLSELKSATPPAAARADDRTSRRDGTRHYKSSPAGPWRALACDPISKRDPAPSFNRNLLMDASHSSSY